MKIRKAKPSRLYVASDGPKENASIEEKAKVEKIRIWITKAVDWNCQVKYLFQKKNLGCARAVSEAITWFFSLEEEGIILEDDCVPDIAFFRFCSEMLDLYRTEKCVWSISGDNFQPFTGENNTYYFSKYFHCWGWATWRRAWLHFPGCGKSFYDSFLQSDIKDLSDENRWFEIYWKTMAKRGRSGKVDSWAYPYLMKSLMEGALHVHPSVNLVENIGFEPDSTHTKSTHHHHKRNSIHFPLVPAECIIRDVEKDIMTDRKFFRINIKNVLLAATRTKLNL